MNRHSRRAFGLGSPRRPEISAYSSVVSYQPERKKGAVVSEEAFPNNLGHRRCDRACLPDTDTGLSKLCNPGYPLPPPPSDSPEICHCLAWPGMSIGCEMYNDQVTFSSMEVNRAFCTDISPAETNTDSRPSSSRRRGESQIISRPSA